MEEPRKEAPVGDQPSTLSTWGNTPAPEISAADPGRASVFPPQPVPTAPPVPGYLPASEPVPGYGAAPASDYDAAPEAARGPGDTAAPGYVPVPGGIPRSAPAAGTPKPPFSLSPEDRRALLPAALAAICFALVFRLLRLFTSDTVPGVGAAVFYLLLLAGGLRVGRGRLRFGPDGTLLLTAAGMLALSFVFTGDLPMRFLNLGLTPLCLIAAFGALHRGDGSGLRFGALLQSLRRFLRALFPRFFWPARALMQNRRGSRWPVLLGLAVAVPLAAVVLALLSDADAVFADLVRRITVPEHFAEWLWLLLRIAFYFGVLYSLLTALIREPAALREHAPTKPLPAGLAAAVLLVLDVIYAVFVAVQFKYFFGGAETAAMEGGFAQYARSGFFQLTAVALINLGCAFPAAASGRESPAVRVLAALLLAATAVIAVSACMRMSLYVRVYGLSLLRLLTYWGMAMIVLALFAAAVKLWRPEVRVFPLLLSTALLTWAALSVIGPSRLVSRWNVAAWEDGSVEELDAEYLARLSPDTRPQLMQALKVAESRKDAEASEKIAEALEQQRSWMCGVDLPEQSLVWWTDPPVGEGWNGPRWSRWYWNEETASARDETLFTLELLLDTDDAVKEVGYEAGAGGKTWVSGGFCNADGSLMGPAGRDPELHTLDFDGQTVPEDADLHGFWICFTLTDAEGVVHDAEGILHLDVTSPYRSHLPPIRISGSAETGYRVETAE